jgi:hypothetical protein
MRIEIQDPSGLQHSISSRNPETIGRWIIETWIEMAVGGWDLREYRPRVMVWPSIDRENPGIADWVSDIQILGEGMTPATPEEMLAALQEQVLNYRKKNDGKAT